MAIDGVPWSFTALLALSLPPALLLLLARRSKRSEKNNSSRRSSSSMRMRALLDVMLRTSTPTLHATRRSGVRETSVPSLCQRAHATCTGSAVAKVFLFACTAAVMIPDDVGAFWGAGCILTVREHPSLTLSHSRWAQVARVFKPDDAGRRRPTSSYLAGKVVWITGASSGLGEQLAIAASAGGARGVIISGRREDALERVRRACEDARPSGWAGGADAVRVLPFDVGDLGFVEREATSRAVGEFGTIDALVLNAGISTRGSVEETSLDVDKRVMDVNYFGAIGLAKGLLEACAPPLPTGARGVEGQTDPNGGGGGWTGSDVRFVVVNSVQGKFGMAFRSSYAASKHALVGFFDCLRAERAQQGVGVLSVFPGYVRTSLSLNALTGDGSEHAKMDPTTASGRDPREVADEIWAAAAVGKEELVIADLKTNVAVLLRVLAPRVLFGIIAKRAVKKGAH